MNTTALAVTFVLACATCAQATEAGTATAKRPTSAPPSSATKEPSARTTPANTGEATTEEAAVIEQFISLQDAAISTFLELGGTLRRVTDRESADEAVPTVKMAGEQLYTIITAVEALGEPSEAAQQAIMARVANVAEKNEIIEQVMVPLLTLMMQEPPCYGSEPLQTELTNLLANLQGAAGIEEEEEEEPEPPAPLQEPDSEEQQPD